MPLLPLVYGAEKREIGRFPEMVLRNCTVDPAPTQQENAQRKQIKNMLQGWARDYPGRIESLATSLKNVVPSHLADARLFDFVGLTQHTVVAEGDTAFDPIELPAAPRTQTVRLLRPGADED